MRSVYGSPKIDAIRLTIVCRTIDMLGFLLKPFAYKGFYRSSGLLSKLLPGSHHLVVALNNDKFLFSARDPYWLRLISSNFWYEIEIEQILRKIGAIDYAFLDCGSNLGYWAIKATGGDFGQHPTVAIEPVPQNFKLLEENRKLNNDRFRTIQAALYSKPDLNVSMIADPGDAISNVGAHIDIESSTKDAIAFVKTVTIEQVVTMAGFEGRKLVIKLDVEGAEVPALEGAGTTLSNDALIMYEDHGKDKESIISRYLLDKGFVIFWVSNGAIKKIDGIEQIIKIKNDPTDGYNFFATLPNSSFEKILSGL